MPQQIIPGTELKVSELCLGTANMGGAINETDSFRLLDAYLDLGGNFIDTAKVYSDWLPGERSISEKTIGRWLALGGRRSQIVLATKGGHPDMAKPRVSRLSKREIVADIEASLQHLRADYIDLYWIHRDDRTRPVEGIIDALSMQVRAGNIRHYGVSNWRTDRIQAALDYCRKRGISPVVASQMLWNVAVIDHTAFDPAAAWMDGAMWQFHRRTNLTAIPYSSQAGGLYQKMKCGLLDGERRSGRSMYPFEPNYQRYLRIGQIAEQCGYTVTQVVLAYLLSQPFTVVPIVGPNTEAQLSDSMGAGDCRLDAHQMDYLTGKSPARGMHE